MFHNFVSRFEFIRTKVSGTTHKRTKEVVKRIRLEFGYYCHKYVKILYIAYYFLRSSNSKTFFEKNDIIILYTNRMRSGPIII